MTRLRLVLMAVLLMAAGPAPARGPEQDDGRLPEALPSESGDTAASYRTVEIIMREHDGRMSFTPDVVFVTNGEEVRFRMKNDGVLEHQIMIGTAEEIIEHAELMRATPNIEHEDAITQRFAPNARGSIVLRFTTPGEFEFACLVPGHIEAGMKGKIIVK